MKDFARLLLFAAVISVAVFTCSVRGKEYLPHYKIKITAENLPDGIFPSELYISNIELFSEEQLIPFSNVIKDSVDSQFLYVCESVPEGEYTIQLGRMFDEPVFYKFTVSSDTLIKIQLKDLKQYKTLEHLKEEFLPVQPIAIKGTDVFISTGQPFKRNAKITGEKLLKGTDIPLGDTVKLKYINSGCFHFREENIKFLKKADGSYLCALSMEKMQMVSPITGETILCALLDFQNECIQADLNKDVNQWSTNSCRYYLNLGNEVMVFSDDNNSFYTPFTKLKQKLRLTDSNYFFQESYDL